MALLTTKERKRLPLSDFALPGRRYPIENKAHARNALGRVKQFGTKAEQQRVKAAVHRKYPDLARLTA
jgi:hypothetical protein